MKPAAKSTLILVTASRAVRADFVGGELRACHLAPRHSSGSMADAVRAALALGGGAALVWVLSDEVFSHRVSLSAAQVAGLTPEQLGRALSFEVEPFSGIPVAESATGFYRHGNGAFDVVELPRSDRDAIQLVAKDGGGKLLGIAHCSPAPEDEGALREWLSAWLPRLQGGALPLITASAPAPAANRFFVTFMVLEVAAILLLLALGGMSAFQRASLERQNAELAAATNELNSATKQIEALNKERAALDKEEAQRERVLARRGALLALLKGLAATHTDEVVVRGIATDGPSSLVVSGLSLEAGAVDELSIVLTQTLRGAGWTAQPRTKTGTRNLPSGGPWEFSLTVTHAEAARVTQPTHEAE
ncbi:MAG: hypothetical protein ACOYMN_09225 [Roseimicrobium sp.]